LDCRNHRNTGIGLQTLNVCRTCKAAHWRNARGQTKDFQDWKFNVPGMNRTG
jgi:hypothetical protein